MNFRYVEAFEEIQHLAMKAFIKGDEDYALTAFKEISETINAAIDGAAGVRALPGCPSLMPAKVIPHDEPAADVPRTEEEKQGTCSCFSLGNGAFPIRRANTEAGTMEHVWIDGRRFTMEVVVVNNAEDTKECVFTIRDNGKIKISGHFHGGKAIAEKVAHAALKEYITNLSGNGKHKSRGGFLEQALKRLQAKEQA